jgi:AAA+ superfamily predicted ATPase
VTDVAALDWEDGNLRHLRLQIDRVVNYLTDEATTSSAVDESVGGPWVLDQVVEVFGLSDFERDVLVLSAGAEIDPRIGGVLGQSEACTTHGMTFGFALGRLPGAHWSALAPTAPLRRWRLLRISGEPGAVIHEPLRIDDRLLLALLGVSTLDATLDRYCRPLAVPESVPASSRRAADALERRWHHGEPVAVQVLGRNSAARHDVVALAAAELGLRAYLLPLFALPQDPAGLDEFARLVEREACLGRVLVLIEADDGDSAAHATLDVFVRRLAVRVAVSARERLSRWPDGSPAIDVAEPSPSDVLAHWEQVLAPSDALADIAYAFPVEPGAASSVIDEACEESVATGVELEPALRSAARRRTRASLDGLAMRVDAEARWDDIVLPDSAMRTMQVMAAHVRHRRKVHHEWGFADHIGTPAAVTGLFRGPSGTGKTLAARVLATELGLDLYIVDLAQVVSKYIGETEKHLRDLFDRADRGSCVLLFDEADALFGKRSEVHDARDRYANIEVSYLLQRVESYRGLAILTSNLPANIDQAFVRRLRYSITFPFPDAQTRAEIWRRAFPPAAPVDALNVDVLARLSITGAAIASIALGAAVLAAEDGSPVTMGHILRAAHTEYAKGDRQLSATELQGWVAA